MLRSVTALGLLLFLCGCRGGLAGGVYTRGNLQYRVAEPSGWKPVAFDDNDLAWLGPNGHVLAMNATCEGHEDPPLDVLTNHLVIGFTDRQWGERQKVMIDGREAQRSQVTAKLDGVPVSLELVVLKKNGCVHDFTYISPLGREAEQRAAFEKLVTNFRQEHGP